MFLKKSDAKFLREERLFLAIAAVYCSVSCSREVNLLMFVTLVMCTFADSRRDSTVLKKCRPPQKISLISDHIFLLFHLLINGRQL